MTITHRTYDSIDDVDPAAWDACLNLDAEVFATRAFVRATERSMTDTRFRHVMFFNADDEPIASASLCIYTVDMALLAEGAARTITKFVGRIIPRLIHVPIAMCGLPVSAGQSNLRFRANADVPAVLELLDQLLTDWAKQHRAIAIVLKEFTDEQCDQIAAVASLGYRRADSLPMNRTDAVFSNFDAYMADLKSRQRYPIKKARQKFEQSGLEIVQVRGGEGADQIYTDEVHKLYLAVLDRAEVKFELLPAEFFRELARELPQNCWFTFVVDKSQSPDEVLAFAASAFSQTSYHQMFVGVRYDKKAESDLYFNLFFHAIDAAFQQGTDEIHVGQSADEFKRQKFRCWQQPISFYVKPVRLSAKLGMAFAFRSIFPPHPARCGKLGRGAGDGDIAR